MKKRRVLAAIMTATLALSLAGCGGSSGDSKSSGSSDSSVANADKPLCWFNRQPSNSSTGELDKEALNFNDDTYYVGFDANQGAELQGQMVVDYIKANADKIDRNGDGVIGYVLAIGDIGHNDSIARTRGVRSALGTGIDANGEVDSTPAGTNVDGKAKVVKDATLDVNGKTYTIRELASQEMKNSAGATWDAATAGNAIGTWSASFGEQIDVVVSNNDGMGMSADEAGNCLTEGEDYRYSEEDRSYYALNVAVTADNYKDFTDSTKVYDKVSKQLDSSKSPSKKVWLDIYNASDNFLSSTYQPLLENYDDLLNLTVDYIGGDGQTESNITNRLGNPSEYDAFAINMVKTDNASSYTSLLK